MGLVFLGSQLLQRLLPISNKITVIDDLSTGHRAAIPISDKLHFIQTSITNEAVLESILPDVEYIFHLACRNLLLSTHDVVADFETNLYGGFLLLEKASRLCTRLRHFVYTSTASVYGEAKELPTPETFYQITNPYAGSKFGTEHYCHVFYHLRQLPVTVLRLSNVYGPGQVTTNPYCGVVAKFFEAIINKEPLVIYGDGLQTRDFTYVDDAIEAIVAVCGKQQALGKVYNVGTGIETSVMALAQTVMQLMDVPEYPLLYKVKRDVDTVQRRAVRVIAIESEIGWRAINTLQTGIARTKKWLMGRDIS